MESKLFRFVYLSEYYISLLKVAKELEEKWVIKVQIWVSNMIEFSTWRIKEADYEFNKNFRETLVKMIKATEKELKEYCDTQQ